MKRKKVSNEELDPSLMGGYGYFVGEEGYQAHLASHAGDKQEVCLFPLDTRHEPPDH